MPEKQTVQRAKKDLREGKSASTAAGEFVREEIHHIREGKHGAKSTKQAIAIGLSKARRSGVPRASARRASPGRRGRLRAQTSRGCLGVRRPAGRPGPASRGSRRRARRG